MIFGLLCLGCRLVRGDELQLRLRLRRLRNELEDSRDYIFRAAGVPQDLFRPN